MKLQKPYKVNGTTRKADDIRAYHLFQATITFGFPRPAIGGVFIRVFNGSGKAEIINLDSGLSLSEIYYKYKHDLTHSYRKEDILSVDNLTYLEADIVITGESKE